MHLYELTGYKSHPIYKAASQLKPKGPEQTFNISYDLSSMKAFTKSLEEHDWDRIGGGKFSTVYQHPNYPYVVKVFVDDPEYLRYMKMVKQNQGNPHAPKMRGGFMRLGDQGYAVRVEPLTPLSGPNDPIIRRYVDPELDPTLDNMLDNVNVPFLEEYHPEFLDYMMDIFDMTTELDWHEANVMKRGNTLVITDPLAP